MQEIQKVRTKTFPPHLLQVCRVRQESDLHHTQNWLTTAVRHLKPCKCLYQHSQSPVNRTGKHITLKKTQVRYFLEEGNISSLLLVLTFKSELLFFSFSVRKRASKSSKMEWKRLEHSLSSGKILMAKLLVQPD